MPTAVALAPIQSSALATTRAMSCKSITKNGLTAHTKNYSMAVLTALIFSVLLTLNRTSSYKAAHAAFARAASTALAATRSISLDRIGAIGQSSSRPSSRFDAVPDLDLALLMQCKLSSYLGRRIRCLVYGLCNSLYLRSGLTPYQV